MQSNPSLGKDFEKNSDKQDLQRCPKRIFEKKGKQRASRTYVAQLHSIELKIPIERINTIHFGTTSEIIIFAFNALNSVFRFSITRNDVIYIYMFQEGETRDEVSRKNSISNCCS